MSNEKKPEVLWQGFALRTVSENIMSTAEGRAVLVPGWTPARVVCEWKHWDAMGEVFWLAAEATEDRAAIMQAALVARSGAA